MNFSPTRDLLNREEKTQIVLTFIIGSAVTDCVLECGWGPSALLQRMAIALCVTQAVCETLHTLRAVSVKGSERPQEGESPEWRAELDLSQTCVGYGTNAMFANGSGDLWLNIG